MEINGKLILVLTALVLLAFSAGSACAMDTQLTNADRPPGAGHLKSAASEKAEDIRDIAGPVRIETGRSPAVYAAGALLLLPAGWFLMKKLKNRPGLSESADEAALTQLEKAARHIPRGDAKTYSTEVSGIMRTYMEKRFDLKVSSQTTQEFLRNIKYMQPDEIAEHETLLKEFLNHCDMAKFACFDLSADQMKAMHESAKNFIEKTRIVKERTSPSGREEAPAEPLPGSFTAAGGLS